MKTRTAKYSYKAYPSPDQERYLAGAFGAVRFVYNSYVWDKEVAYQSKSGTKPRKLDLAKGLPTDLAWLSNYSTTIRQQSRRQAEAAYKNFFEGLSGKRKSKPGKPTFKKKRASGSLTWNGKGTLQVKQLSKEWAAVRIPKESSWLKFRLSRALPSKPTGVTLKLSSSGEYTVSFTVQQQVAEPKTVGSAAGVDPGLTDLVTVVRDSGERYKVASPKIYRRAERKLARLQRDLSRKQKTSSNRERARLALAKQHAKIARSRLDLARKIAYKLADENQAVALEDLTVKRLSRGMLAKSFHDAGLGQLKACVEQACQKLGTSFKLVDPAFTSQACSVCASIDGPKALSVREWSCDCGIVLDRDYNAALNMLLLAGGHSDSLNGLGGQVSRRKLASCAVSVEEVTPVFAAHKPRKQRLRKVSLARRAKLTASV